MATLVTFFRPATRNHTKLPQIRYHGGIGLATCSVWMYSPHRQRYLGRFRLSGNVTKFDISVVLWIYYFRKRNRLLCTHYIDIIFPLAIYIWHELMTKPATLFEELCQLLNIAEPGTRRSWRKLSYFPLYVHDKQNNQKSRENGNHGSTYGCDDILFEWNRLVDSK